VADRAKGDDDGGLDVARPDGCFLHVDIRLAALRRLPVGATRQVLRPVHGGCAIQLSPAGARHQPVSQVYNRESCKNG